MKITAAAIITATLIATADAQKPSQNAATFAGPMDSTRSVASPAQREFAGYWVRYGQPVETRVLMAERQYVDRVDGELVTRTERMLVSLAPGRALPNGWTEVLSANVAPVRSVDSPRMMLAAF